MIQEAPWNPFDEAHEDDDLREAYRVPLWRQASGDLWPMPGKRVTFRNIRNDTIQSQGQFGGLEYWLRNPGGFARR